MLHQTDTACTWLVRHSWGGGTVQIVSIYPSSPEARPPSFFREAAVRPRSMAGAPTPCRRHWDVSRESGASASQVSDPSTAIRRRGRSIITTLYVIHEQINVTREWLYVTREWLYVTREWLYVTRE